MTTSCNSEIFWDGREYSAARRIGFDEGRFIVDLFTTPAPEPRGTYFTALPISPSSYRERHATKAAYADAGDALTVYCDWGRPHLISGPRDVLDALVAECIANGLTAQEPKQ